MKKIKCSLANGTVIIQELYIADTFMDRLCGLMFTPKENKKSLLLSPTQSIHTCFMNFNIDVAFIDSKDRVIKIIKNMKPWRVTGFYWKAKCALEVPAGELPKEIDIGTKVEFMNV